VYVGEGVDAGQAVEKCEGCWPMIVTDLSQERKPHEKDMTTLERIWLPVGNPDEGV
jgi:hypothetical protein